MNSWHTTNAVATKLPFDVSAVQSSRDANVIRLDVRSLTEISVSVSRTRDPFNERRIDFTFVRFYSSSLFPLTGKTTSSRGIIHAAASMDLRCQRNGNNRDN